MEVLQPIYDSSKLTVAAINGIALGGGLETALACHYRFAAPDAKVGVPEVHLGLLPGAGGTQALPRIAGVQTALDMIVSGKPIRADKAAAAGIVDRIHEPGTEFVDAAVAYARELLEQGAPLKSAASTSVDTSDVGDSFLDDYRKSIARRTRGFCAPEKCIQAVEAACELSFAEGLEGLGRIALGAWRPAVPGRLLRPDGPGKGPVRF